MIKLNMGARGELVIPKKVREAFGMHDTVFMKINESSVEILATDDKVLDRMRTRAKEHNVDVTKWKMGSDLYEEVF